MTWWTEKEAEGKTEEDVLNMMARNLEDLLSEISNSKTLHMACSVLPDCFCCPMNDVCERVKGKGKDGVK